MIAVCLGALVLAFVIFVGVEHVRGARALAARLGELRAKGEKLAYTELIPPRPTADQNAFPALMALTNQLTRRSQDRISARATCKVASH